MSPIAFGALCFSSLLTVIDPLAAAPIFASMTKNASPQMRKRAVWRACFTAFVVLVAFAFGGTYLLRLLRVTIESFRIAGGILFGLLGLSMLGALGAAPKAEEGLSGGEDPSVVPLGVPLIGGPGAMSTVMVLVGQAQGSTQLVLFGVALIAALLVTALLLAVAPWLLRKMGAAGVELITKVMGLIVLVIGVQFVIDGVRGLISA